MSDDITSGVIALVLIARLQASVSAVFSEISTLNTKVDTIMATLADIQTAETDEAAAVDGVLSEVAQLQADLKTAQSSGSDPATVQAIVDQIHATTAKLTAALPAASTPATPADPAAPAAA